MKVQVYTIWLLLRLGLGWIYLWAFLDKTFGLGFATAPGNGWLEGGSPTTGFLTYATKGPFVDFFQSLAGVPAVDWLFMLGVLFVGVTLISGIMIRLGAFTSLVMSLLFFSAGFIPPEHNPIIDEHIIYALVFIGIILTVPSSRFDLSRLWRRLPFVRNKTFLY